MLVGCRVRDWGIVGVGIAAGAGFPTAAQPPIIKTIKTNKVRRINDIRWVKNNFSM
jgi:hypothetical protein